jgi:putative two-component system response regulator
LIEVGIVVGTYYVVSFTLSIVLLLIYVFVYHRHYDVHMSAALMLAAFSNFAQLQLSECKSVEAALLANRFLYISGCYLILMITLVIFDLCDIKLGRYVKLTLYLFTTTVFFCVQQMGLNDLYYKNVSITVEGGATVLVKEYGVLHPIYYAMLVFYFLLGMGAIIYSFFKKSQVSKHFLILLTVPEILSVAAFFASRIIPIFFGTIPEIELVPFTYNLTAFVYLIITHQLALYNISDTMLDSIVENGDYGFISFTFKFCYLGSNETAKNIFPELNELVIDKPVKNENLKNGLIKWIEDFSIDNTRDKVRYSASEKSYVVNICYLYDGDNRRRGYQIYIVDDTKNQQYIDLLDNFNAELQQEVAEKTEHIIEMHNNLIMGMAIMVEGRDNSTGGHIRRTSYSVRILVDEIRRGNDFVLSEQFCKNIVKAAPMHDLGKITIDDAILRKPGRFTPEEFEIMKTHAAEGAKIVHEILKGTDDDDFLRVAENVAHYHHERWDGNGYPEGLKGEEIPLEARIMAIADVYDALVSKRAYKDRMTYDEADKIILDGMGKQFDGRLEKYYIAARPRLKQYYKEEL